jgi:hypothetical protein
LPQAIGSTAPNSSELVLVFASSLRIAAFCSDTSPVYTTYKCAHQVQGDAGIIQLLGMQPSESDIYH